MLLFICLLLTFHVSTRLEDAVCCVMLCDGETFTWMSLQLFVAQTASRGIISHKILGDAWNVERTKWLGHV